MDLMADGYSSVIREYEDSACAAIPSSFSVVMA